MKRSFFIQFVILFFSFNLFAQEAVFILEKDSVITDMDLDEHNFSKGQKFLYNFNSDGFGVDITNPLNIEIFLHDIKGIGYSCNINDVYLSAYEYKINSDIKNNYWIPSYYYDLLESKNVKSDLLKFESYWESFDNPTEEYYLTWFDFFKVQKFYFEDFYFVVFGRHVYDDVDFFAYLEEVSDNKIIYNVQRIYSHFFDYKERTIYVQPEYISLFEKETPFKIILTINGDYMKMYIDEVSERNLFQTLVRTTPETCNQIEEEIKSQ